MSLLVPRLLHQIWVGPLAPPVVWMQTWKDHHPSWKYVIWGNDELNGRRWRLQRAIDHYSSKAQWAGVADCMRYEILWEYGGFMPGADCVCERPVDELFADDNPLVFKSSRAGRPHAWAVWENEDVVPDYITPVYAAEPGSVVCETMMRLIDKADEFKEPWVSVGNTLMGKVYVLRGKPDLTVWPSWYFNPVHHTGVEYKGDGVPYGRQMWGSTKGLYG